MKIIGNTIKLSVHQSDIEVVFIFLISTIQKNDIPKQNLGSRVLWVINISNIKILVQFCRQSCISCRPTWTCVDSFVDLPAEVGSLLCCLMILMMFETDKITWWNRHKTEWIKKLIDLLSIIKVQIYREHATINHVILKSQKNYVNL